MAQDVPQMQAGPIDAMIGVDIDLKLPCRPSRNCIPMPMDVVCAVCCVQRRELTVRGECGNRHSRREAGGRDGVTTLQHGLAADLLSLA